MEKALTLIIMILKFLVPVFLILGFLLATSQDSNKKKIGVQLMILSMIIFTSNLVFGNITESTKKHFYINAEVIGTEFRPETIPFLTSESYNLVFKSEKNVVFESECTKKIFYSIKKGDKVEINVTEPPTENTNLFLSELGKDLKLVQ